MRFQVLGSGAFEIGMHVVLRGCDASVPYHRLNGSRTRAAIYAIRYECVPKLVRGDGAAHNLGTDLRENLPEALPSERPPTSPTNEQHPVIRLLGEAWPRLF